MFTKGVFGMSSLLAYWRWDNYLSDIERGIGHHFNSNQSRLHLLEPNDKLWLVSTVLGRTKARKSVILACLVVRAKTFNLPGYIYGRYRVWGDLELSRYFFVEEQADASELLRKLRFSTNKPIGQSETHIAQHLQTIRELHPSDIELLETWVANLPIERRAYRLLKEDKLEIMRIHGEEAGRRFCEKYGNPV